jgi:hypothetical protein
MQAISDSLYRTLFPAEKYKNYPFSLVIQSAVPADAGKVALPAGNLPEKASSAFGCWSVSSLSSSKRYPGKQQEFRN